MTHQGEPATARLAPVGADAPTLPTLLAAQVRLRGDAVALLHKRHGVWQTWTWRQAADEVARLAAGIRAHGVREGEPVVIAGANRPRLLFALLACQQMGAVAVLVPQADAGVPIEVVLDAHRPGLVFAAGEYEVHAILAAAGRLARQPSVVCDDARGLRRIGAPWLSTIADFVASGQRDVAPALVHRIAALVYDQAKVATALSHDGVIQRAEAAMRDAGIGPADRGFLAVPLGWQDALALGPALSLLSGASLAFPEDDSTVPQDLREAGPSFLFGPPGLFRQLRQMAFLHTVTAAWPWRGLLTRAFGFAGDAPATTLFARLATGPARDRLGLARLRAAFATTGLLSPQVATFLAAIGVTVHPAGAAADATAVAEALLQGQLHIRHAYVVRRERGDLAALIALDANAVALWAQLRGERVRSIDELAALDSVHALIAAEIAAVHQGIVAFHIAPHGFSVPTGELAGDLTLRPPAIERLHDAVLRDLRSGGGLRVRGADALLSVTRPSAPATLSAAIDSAAA